MVKCRELAPSLFFKKKKMLEQLIKNSAGIEVQINSTGVNAKFPFQNKTILNKGALLTGIAAFTSGQLTACPSGRGTVTNAEALDLVIVLYDMNEAVIEEIPYHYCVPALNGGITRGLNKIRANITACEIRTFSGAGLSGNTSAYLILHYDK